MCVRSRQDFYALSGEQAGLRKPQSMPQCMAGLPGAKPIPQEHIAVGRGRSKLENAPVYIPGMPMGRGRGKLDDKAANPVLEKALQQASLPLRTYERKEKLHQQYIPGILSVFCICLQGVNGLYTFLPSNVTCTCNATTK